MEVPISSPEGLYLRDVIDKLNALRGRGMASLYLWSCKRSYKNGFVWHDFCEDGLILTIHESFGPIGNVKIQNLKQLPEPVSCRSHDDASTSSSLNEKETRNSQENELSSRQETDSSDVSQKTQLSFSLSLSFYMFIFKFAR